MRKVIIIALGIILISFLIGIYFYPQMPEQMASHWNATGEVDGFLPKFWGLFLIPMMSLGLFLLFLVIPKIDPLKANIEKFRKYFDGFIILIFGFLFYIYLLTIFWNLGFRFALPQLMIPALGALFYYCGILVENAKRNWFIGIRTPWTLSNEQVWDKTHKLGGKLFKSAGLIAFFGIIFVDYAPYFILFPIIFIAFYLIAFSYFEYQRQEKKKFNPNL